MFTHSELVSSEPGVVVSKPPEIEIVRFVSEDFASSSSEELIEVYRGSKQVFSSGLRFWIKALQAQGWLGREAYFIPYAHSALCAPIDEKEFVERVVASSHGLQKPLPEFLLPPIGFQSGLRMYDDWNDVGLAAELADSYVAFFWSTTA